MKYEAMKRKKSREKIDNLESKINKIQNSPEEEDKSQVENFKEAIKLLVKSKEAEVFIIQGPGEENLISKFTDPYNSYGVIIPPLSIPQLTYLIKLSKLLVCNHTGIMHLASAVKTPSLTIFKHGEIKRWGPICNRHIVLEERNGKKLSPTTVLESIHRLLNANEDLNQS